MTDEQIKAVAKRIKDEFPGVMKQWVAVRLARAAIEAYEAVKGGDVAKRTLTKDEQDILHAALLDASEHLYDIEAKP